VAAVINGPIRDKLNMNYGIGAMGPFSDVNASIGRAWTMLSKNLGNCGLPGETYMGTQGNVISFNNLVFPENEKDSPWTPFHVQKGFQARRKCRQRVFRLRHRSGTGRKGQRGEARSTVRSGASVQFSLP
jgi:hypothetical protein